MASASSPLPPPLRCGPPPPAPHPMRSSRSPLKPGICREPHIHSAFGDAKKPCGGGLWAPKSIPGADRHPSNLDQESEGENLPAKISRDGSPRRVRRDGGETDIGCQTALRNFEALAQVLRFTQSRISANLALGCKPLWRHLRIGISSGEFSRGRHGTWQ